MKKGADGMADVCRCAAVHYEGVGGGMPIGLWGAEPQYINSSERITVQADIGPPHPPPSLLEHTFSSYCSRGERRWRVE